MKIRFNIIEGGLNRMSQREATKGFPGISGWVQYYVALCFCVGGNCIVMPVGRTSVNFDNRSRQHGPELSAYHTNTDTDRPRQSQGYLSVVGARQLLTGCVAAFCCTMMWGPRIPAITACPHTTRCEAQLQCVLF